MKPHSQGKSPIISWRKPYEYMVAMIFQFYGEPYASQFSLSYIPLIYYCADEGLSFNWDVILLENMRVALTMHVESRTDSFPIFHIFSYLLDIKCVSHQYPRMGWIWQPSDPTIHTYYKFL
jgi:hypothetical protein